MKTGLALQIYSVSNAGTKFHLFFFSFFSFLFSLRLNCGAFLLSFSPLLFSFITTSSQFRFLLITLYAQRNDNKVSIFNYVSLS